MNHLTAALAAVITFALLPMATDAKTGAPPTQQWIPTAKDDRGSPQCAYRGAPGLVITGGDGISLHYTIPGQASPGMNRMQVDWYGLPRSGSPWQPQTTRVNVHLRNPAIAGKLFYASAMIDGRYVQSALVATRYLDSTDQAEIRPAPGQGAAWIDQTAQGSSLTVVLKGRGEVFLGSETFDVSLLKQIPALLTKDAYDCLDRQSPPAAG